MNAPVRIEPQSIPEFFAAQVVPVRRARASHMRLFSVFVVVLLPLLVMGSYLFTKAADQYESSVGFSVRREEAPGPIDLFGGFSGLSAAGSSDADILHEFLSSQEIVEAVDAVVDLRGRWSAVHATDPIFGFNPKGTIEDLVDYWGRMAKLSYDTGSGILTLRVYAFNPQDAQIISSAALQISSELIDELSSIAQSDILIEAETSLDEAADRLRAARQALTAFRAVSQVVDPGADVSGQMGLLTRLQEELANELIRLDLLRTQTRSDDPRIDASEQRIQVIEERIAGERRKIGSGGSVVSDQDYASVMAEFERLAMDVEFAQESYLATRGAYDLAVAEARRRTRYLAAHIRPTLAERATAPDPVVILGLGGLFLCLIWAVGALSWAAMRDRS